MENKKPRNGGSPTDDFPFRCRKKKIKFRGVFFKEKIDYAPMVDFDRSLGKRKTPPAPSERGTRGK